MTLQEYIYIDQIDESERSLFFRRRGFFLKFSSPSALIKLSETSRQSAVAVPPAHTAFSLHTDCFSTKYYI